MNKWFRRLKSPMGRVLVIAIFAGVVAILVVPSSANSPQTANVSNGGWATCVVRESGRVACLQAGSWQQVEGIEGAESVSVVHIDGIWGDYEKKYESACVLHRDGTVSCWGRNAFGQLGDGTTDDRDLPVKVAGVSDAHAISVAAGSACALLDDATVTCWGRLGAAEFGDATVGDPLAPIQIAGVTGASAIATYGIYSGDACAVVGSGGVECWGLDGEGAAPLPGIIDALSLSQGGGTMCIIYVDGRASCGLSDDGKPIYIDGVSDAAQISSYLFVNDVYSSPEDTLKESGACALLRDGRVSCWDDFTLSATLVDALENVRSVGAAYGRSCALRLDGSVACWNMRTGLVLSCTSPLEIAEQPEPGYWVLRENGEISGFGSASNYCSISIDPAFKAVAIDRVNGGTGLLVVDSSGAVHVAGTATHHGDLSSLAVGDQVSGISATPSGNGYWVFTAQGEVHAFGDAGDFGDLRRLNIDPVGLIVDSAVTPSGQGYYLLGADGGVFAFGDAVFVGSLPGVLAPGTLACPVVGIVPTPSGGGYWLVACDGGVFAFGDAEFKGSLPGVLALGQQLNAPISGMVLYYDGYLMVASDGGLFNFSSGPFIGSLGSYELDSAVVGVTAFAP